jgi:hypothetical protein
VLAAAAARGVVAAGLVAEAGVAAGCLRLLAGISFSSRDERVVLWAGDRREGAWAGRSGQHQL